MTARSKFELLLIGAILALVVWGWQHLERRLDNGAYLARTMTACLNGRTLTVGNRIVTCVVTDVVRLGQ